MKGFIGKPSKENPLYVAYAEKLDKLPAAELTPEAKAKLLDDADSAIRTTVYPAYEKLIAFFDPSSAEAARNARLAVAPRELAAKAITDTRQFESKKPMKVLERKGDDDFFVGSGGKKKKGKKPREDVAETSKIDLKLGVLEELARIDVPVPSSREEVPGVLDALRGKLQHYKDNQDKVTKGVSQLVQNRVCGY